MGSAAMASLGETVAAALCNFVHGLSAGTRDVVRRFPGVEEATGLCIFVRPEPAKIFIVL